MLLARDPRDRTVAGFVAFCVHARLRVGDALRISREPLIDSPSGTSDGFIEVSTHNHKTRSRGSKRLLPITALSNGIKVSGWAVEWLVARCKTSMNAVSDKCLLRALCPPDGWETRLAYVAEVTAWIKAFFENEAFTSRPLKLTVLGWAARHGMTRADRRTLRYHVKPKDRQVSIYSRDELSIPLRALAVLYVDVRAGRFLPDETSSGHSVPQLYCGSTSDESSSSRPSEELDRMDRAHSSESVVFQHLDAIAADPSIRREASAFSVWSESAPHVFESRMTGTVLLVLSQLFTAQNMSGFRLSVRPLGGI